MHNKLNKKGFTITELVIVIAVIAILAAVLIPTFVSLVKKANLSSDIQSVRQMNTVLADEWASNGEPETKQAVLDALDKAGYNAKGEEGLVPVSKGHSFYFYMGENIIVLVNNGDNTIVYPEIEVDNVANLIKDGTFVALKGGNMEASVESGDVNSLGNALLTGNKEITLTENVALDVEYTIPAGADVTLNLNGKTLSTEETGGRHKYVNVGKGATLTITSGTVDVRGIQVYDGAKLVIGEGVTINNVDDNGGAAIWVYEGGEVVIDGGTYTALSGDCGTDVVYEPGVINNSGKVTINGGTFTAKSSCYAVNNYGELIINGGTFTATRGVIAGSEGTVTINGGTFTTEDGAAAYVVYANDGDVTINAGTITNGGTTTFCIDGKGAGSINVKAGVVVDGTEVAEDYSVSK